MRECYDADVRRETLGAREMDERPDLCDLERAKGGGSRGGEGVRHFTVCTKQSGQGGVSTWPTYQTLSVTH